MEGYSSKEPRITFGIIVLNGEPFTRYNLRALYPWAHQIIVVEGACPAAAASATEDGHSLDHTLRILREFKEQEDLANKITIVTAEDEGYPSGFWPEKDEMSQAYAKRATGNFLWQVDVDEFYLETDMPRIIDILKKGADALTFRQLGFWGRPDICSDGVFLRSYGGGDFHRLFSWGPNHRYATHRPPTVIDGHNRDKRSLRWFKSTYLRRKGIYLYHYSVLFQHQVLAKSAYYARVEWADYSESEKWAQDCWVKLGNPYRVQNMYNYPSWLYKFNGSTPEQVSRMWDDVIGGLHAPIAPRDCSDVDELLSSKKYAVSIWALKLYASFVAVRKSAFRTLKIVLTRLRLLPLAGKLLGRSASNQSGLK